MADKYDKAAQAEKASPIGKHLNTFTHTWNSLIFQLANLNDAQTIARQGANFHEHGSLCGCTLPRAVILMDA